MIDTMINRSHVICSAVVLLLRWNNMLITITIVVWISLKLFESGWMVGCWCSSGASLRHLVHLNLLLMLLISIQIVIIVSKHRLLFLSHGDDGRARWVSWSILAFCQTAGCTTTPVLYCVWYALYHERVINSRCCCRLGHPIHCYLYFWLLAGCYWTLLLANHGATIRLKLILRNN